MTKKTDTRLTENVQFRMDKASYETLRLQAKEACRSINGHIQWIVNQYIKK